MNQAIKEIREKKGMTQVSIADQVGISVTSYQRIEYGVQRPNLQTAIRIADVLGVQDLRILWSGNSAR